MVPTTRTSLWLLLVGLMAVTVAAQDNTIRHSFLAAGAETRLISGDGQVTWRTPLPTRDGWVLNNGHILLAVSPCEEFPHGGITELSRDQETVFKWQGTQAEVNTVQPLPEGKYLTTE